MSHTLSFESLELTLCDVLHEMGYGKVMPGNEILSCADSMFKKVAEVARPLCMLQIFDGTLQSQAVRLHSGEVLHTGNVISHLLEGSTRFALFAATCGEAFRDLQEQIKEENDMLHLFILDAIGNCVVERAGDLMEQLLEKEIGSDHHTNRFSPGYCGWPLTDQKQLFSLLGNHPCGITLSDSCLMSPIKSISGIIGIGERVNEKRYGCQFCQMKTCYKRKS